MTQVLGKFCKFWLLLTTCFYFEGQNKKDLMIENSAQLKLSCFSSYSLRCHRTGQLIIGWFQFDSFWNSADSNASLGAAGGLRIRPITEQRGAGRSAAAPSCWQDSWRVSGLLSGGLLTTSCWKSPGLVQLEGGPGMDPNLAGRVLNHSWPENPSGSFWRSWRVTPRREHPAYLMMLKR